MASRKSRRYVPLIVLLLCLGSMFSPLTSMATQLSPGVNHQAEQKVISGSKQSFNQLTVNLANPYTKIDIGMPDPINSLSTLSSIVKRNTYDQHRVIGGINASFFHLDSRLPSYLLAKDNQIMNLGVVSSSSNDFMYTPAAFGVTQSGKGQIGRYNLSAVVTHKNNSFTLSGINRNRNDGESILYTKSFRYDNTRTNPFGLEVVVTGLSKSIDYEASFGETLTGKVSSIRPYGQHTSATIPKDGYVLSANGANVQQLKGMAIGDEISIKLDVDNQWKNSEFMLASGPLLVQNGKANLTIDSNSPRLTERAPRTAVAVDSTGDRVFFVTVDGRQPGYSTGMNMKEFADYLVSIGAYHAMNLDGGGSTSMVTRKYGEEFATLVNRPSDGRERGVSAVLQAISTAPLGSPSVVKAKQQQNGLVAKGASVGFEIDYVLDQYFNSISFEPSRATYTVEGNIGRIENGKFIGEQAGSGNVVVKYGTATTKVPVKVVDSIGTLTANVDKIRLVPGDRQVLDINATSTTGEPLIFNEQEVKWSASGNLGTFEGNYFVAGTTEGSGVITASFGNKSVSIPVVVSTKPVLVQGLNSTANISADHIRATSILESDKILQAKEGDASLKLRYSFPKTQSGVSAAYVNFKNPSPIEGKPVKIGTWVYGDGAGHWLRGKITDANGKSHTVDFTGYGELNWYGWKYTEAIVPSTVRYPIKLEQIYLTEPEDVKKGSGFIYLDKIQAVYTNTFKETAFEPASKPMIVDKNKKFTVAFNMPMSQAWVTNKTIYVEDQTGKRIPGTVKLIDGGKKAEVLAPSSGYESGKEYRLVVTRYAKSTKNVLMNKDHITPFKVK